MAETQDQEALDLAGLTSAVQAITSLLPTIKQGILDLEAALKAAGGSTTPAVDTALANLKSAIGDASTAASDAASALPPAPAPPPTPAPPA